MRCRSQGIVSWFLVTNQEKEQQHAWSHICLGQYQSIYVTSSILFFNSDRFSVLCLFLFSERNQPESFSDYCRDSCKMWVINAFKQFVENMTKDGNILQQWSNLYVGYFQIKSVNLILAFNCITKLYDIFCLTLMEKAFILYQKSTYVVLCSKAPQSQQLLIKIYWLYKKTPKFRF